MNPLSIFSISTAVAAALSLVAFLVFSLWMKNSTGRRVSVILLGVFGIGAVTGALFLADRDPNLPSLTEMQSRFPDNRSKFEELQRMAEEDNKLTAIAPDFVTALPTSANPTAFYRYGDPQAPLPKARWDSYKSKLAPFGNLASVERTEFGDVTIYTWNGPWRGLYRMTGYTHCTKSPMTPTQSSTLRRKPCGDGVLPDSTAPASLSMSAEQHKRFSNYLSLNDGWYAFEIGID